MAHKVNGIPATSKAADWFPKDFSDGAYEDAFNKGESVTSMLERERFEKTGEKSHYHGMNHLEIVKEKLRLEKAGQPVPATAFDECLKAAGITRFDRVDKFFQYGDISTLFPEVISSKIYAGLLQDSLVPEFTMGEVVLSDGLEYKKIKVDDSEAQRQLGLTGKGAELATTTIQVGEESIHLAKYGRYLEIAYEDLKYQRLNLFGAALTRIGQQMQIDLTDDMIYTIINGDGNSNTPATTVTTAATGTVAVADVIEWSTCMPSPYKMSKFVGKKALLQEYWTTLAGMNNPSDQFGFVGIALPRAYEWDRSVVTSDRFFGVDQRYAIEHFTAGGIVTEAEKIIRKQINGTAITHWSKFGIFDNNATAIFDETH
jgi:hypothetical protein